MMAELEKSALSGDLFRHSPALGSHTFADSYDEAGDEDPSACSSAKSLPPSARVGPRTGPKGVIEDRRSHIQRNRMIRQRAVDAERFEQERKAMVGLTLKEEDELRERDRLLNTSIDDEDEVRERRRQLRREELNKEMVLGNGPQRLDRGHKRGGLREIGSEGFLVAVERPGWVLVLIYEPVSGSSHLEVAFKATYIR